MPQMCVKYAIEKKKSKIRLHCAIVDIELRMRTRFTKRNKNYYQTR